MEGWGGGNKFSQQMNSHLALLSAPKATMARGATVKKQFPVFLLHAAAKGQKPPARSQDTRGKSSGLHVATRWQMDPKVDFKEDSLTLLLALAQDDYVHLQRDDVHLF